MPAFKDEHIIIIAPGSQITRAQLGLPESFTTPRLFLKSRMFPAEKPGEWEPNKVRKKRKISHPRPDSNHPNGTAEPQTTENAQGVADKEASGSKRDTVKEVDTNDEYEEDPQSDEGAVWPICAGRIVDWPCFYALLQHVHNILSAPFHTPILMIAQPAWTPKDHERITQYMFEKFRMPAFALMDAASAAAYAYGLHTACVVDVGLQKTDITAVTEFLVQDIGRSVAVPGVGGESMTERLLELLGPKGFTKDMCEQLKKSPICEVLPLGVPMPGSTSGARTEEQKNPAAAASTGAEGSGPNQRHSPSAMGMVPRGPGQDTESRPSNNDAEDGEGVVDVAAVVTGGNMREYLESKEREKQERLAAKKKGATDANAQTTKPNRMKNSERERNAFFYEDNALRDALQNSDLDTHATAAALDEGPQAKPSGTSAESVPASAVSMHPPVNDISPQTDSAQRTEAPATSQTASAPSDSSAPAPPQDTAPPQSAPNTSPTASQPQKPTAQTTLQTPRRELTVGTERFRAFSPDHLATLTTAIYHTIQSVPSATLRANLWNALVIIGGGSRVRGFREALLAALNARFLISPSSAATLFTSELPGSGFSTPGGGTSAGTGASTPLPGSHGQVPPGGAGGGVNPMLQAATVAAAQQSQIQNQNQQGFQTPGQPPHAPHTPSGPTANQLATPQTQQATPQHQQQVQHLSLTMHNLSQTPVSIRPAQLPNYFPEFKSADAEAEAVFLGAQVAAKTFFITDGGAGGQRGYMTRSDYNETGPGVVADFVL